MNHFIPNSHLNLHRHAKYTKQFFHRIFYQHLFSFVGCVQNGMQVTTVKYVYIFKYISTPRYKYLTKATGND